MAIALRTSQLMPWSCKTPSGSSDSVLFYARFSQVTGSDMDMGQYHDENAVEVL